MSPFDPTLIARLREHGVLCADEGISVCEYDVQLAGRMLQEAADALEALTAPLHEQTLCQECAGNGTVRLPNGVRVSPTCRGDCWQPLIATKGGEALGPGNA